MAIERIYTLSELAELTGRDTSFWVSECSAGRLVCLKPGPEDGAVLVLESDFERWVSGLRNGPDTPQSAQGRVSPAQAYLTQEEQEACVTAMKEAQLRAYSA